MKVKQFLMWLVLGYVTILLLQSFYGSKSHETVLLWWTPFALEDREIFCGERYHCLVTGDREAHSKHVKSYLFYGSNFDEKDIPLPKTSIPWALYHEESPKNFPMLRDKRIQDLFEITTTFSRYSTFPIPLQYLKTIDELTSKKYYQSIDEKNAILKDSATVLYMQSDCETPIERDYYVKELMKYIKVDSYGSCLNNKELTERLKLNGTYELYDDAFMEFVGRYKFVLAIENSKCFDYVTEKLWRPLMVGSVPIYMGASSVKDWLPNRNSAILFDDYATIKDLAAVILKANKDDSLYQSYLTHKTESKITNQRLINTLGKGFYGIQNNKEEFTIPAFECHVCENVHRKDYLKKKHAKESVYDCEDLKSLDGSAENMWISNWEMGMKAADHLITKMQN